MTRVRMLRNIAHRLDLREGVVCEMTAAEAERFLAARLADPVADPPEETTAETPEAEPPKAKVRKPKTQPETPTAG